MIDITERSCMYSACMRTADFTIPQLVVSSKENHGIGNNFLTPYLFGGDYQLTSRR